MIAVATMPPLPSRYGIMRRRGVSASSVEYRLFFRLVVDALSSLSRPSSS
jgi:hypothetical protein